MADKDHPGSLYQDCIADRLDLRVLDLECVLLENGDMVCRLNLPALFQSKSSDLGKFLRWEL